MAIFLTIASFTAAGDYSIPDAGSAHSVNDVQDCINKHEKAFIYNLLGVVLGDLIIAYNQAGQTPTNIHYDKIIGAFASDLSTGWGTVYSQGITEYLKACIFYEYNKNGLVLSQAGVVNPATETAQKTTPAEALRFAEAKFNLILDTVEAIRYYIFENKDAFPDFNGQAIRVKASNIF